VSRDVTLTLAHLDELFGPPTFPGLGGSADARSGIERLVSQLKCGRGGPVHATLTLPAHELGPDADRIVREAIERYCEVRIEEVERERLAVRSNGFRSLWVGLPILFVGLGLYTMLHKLHASDFLRTYVANGLLLVTAWVGLWYPLDTLVHYGRPYKQEVRALKRLRDAELALHSAAA
jgi:hypothetical protein